MQQPARNAEATAGEHATLALVEEVLAGDSDDIVTQVKNRGGWNSAAGAITYGNSSSANAEGAPAAEKVAGNADASPALALEEANAASRSSRGSWPPPNYGKARPTNAKPAPSSEATCDPKTPPRGPKAPPRRWKDLPPTRTRASGNTGGGPPRRPWRRPPTVHLTRRCRKVLPGGPQAGTVALRSGVRGSHPPRRRPRRRRRACSTTSRATSRRWHPTRRMRWAVRCCRRR